MANHLTLVEKSSSPDNIPVHQTLYGPMTITPLSDSGIFDKYVLSESTPKQMSFMDHMLHVDARQCIQRLKQQVRTISDDYLTKALSEITSNPNVSGGKLSEEDITMLTSLESYLINKPQYAPMLEEVKNLKDPLSTIAGAMVRHDVGGLVQSISGCAATILRDKSMPAEEKYFATQTKKVMDSIIEDLRQGNPTSDDLARKANSVEFYVAAMHKSYNSLPEGSDQKVLAQIAYESSIRSSAIFSDKKVTAGEFAQTLYDIIVPDRKKVAFNITGDGTSEVIEQRVIGLALTQFITNYSVHGAGELTIKMYKKDGQLHIEAENDGHIKFNDPNSIFERGVTTRAGTTGGTGLYLVEEHAKYYSGSTNAENLDDGKVRIGFSMALPKTDELETRVMEQTGKPPRYDMTPTQLVYKPSISTIAAYRPSEMQLIAA